MRDRIGLFGGSFNPVHRGHISAAHSFLESRLIHSLWVLPAPDPPHKEGQLLAPFSHRTGMLRVAFENLKSVRVCEFERDLPRPSYTLQTIEYLQERYPERLFYLCLGGDSLASLTGWYRYREILKRVNLLVAQRPGFDTGSLPGHISERTIFTDHDPVDASSTDYRSERGGRGSRSLVTRPVDEYIHLHGLYNDADNPD